MSDPTPVTKKISAAELARQKSSAPAPAAKAAAKKVVATKPAAAKTAPVAKAKVVAKATTAKAVVPSAPKSSVPAKSGTPAKTIVASRKAPAAPPLASKTASVPAVAKKAKPAATAPVARPVSEEKAAKIKLIRDSFTIPENEYAAIGEIKKACLALGVDVKRTEVIRAGLLVLQQMSAAAIADYIGKQLPKPKTGRPKKAK